MLRAVGRMTFRMLNRFGPPVVDRLNGSRRARLGLAGCTSRPEFLRRVPSSDVLEIGPFDNPALRGPGVSYFDVLDAEALRRRAVEHGHGFADVPATIDYVSPTGDLSVIDRTFDAVLSSHAIEHQPDLVAHLVAVGRLLPPGGEYFLIVPDKRYCFDHYVAQSTIDDVLRAHDEKRRVHTREAVLTHRLEITHNDPLRHWIGLHGTVTRTDDERAVAEADARSADAGAYVDVHAWTFSPESFRAIVGELNRRGLTDLKVVEVADTGFASFEFYAVLQKTG